MDYWKKVMKPVGILYGWIFNVNTLFVKAIFSVKKSLARFNEKYRNLPSERFADEYAIRELSQYL